jgi:hypothetical protein
MSDEEVKRPVIGGESGKEDYYEEGNDPKFTPPCDTCVHRNKELDAIDCPCVKCVHFS